MELSRNEQLVIDVLLDNPSISNRELANRTYIALRTLNGVFIGLYAKFGITGNGRAKRAKLVDKLQSEGIYQ